MVNARTATARDFDAAAHRNAKAFWVWAAIAVVVGLVWRWWATIPAGIATLMVAQSIVAARAALQLRKGTFPIPNPNNGVSDALSADDPAVASGTPALPEEAAARILRRRSPNSDEYLHDSRYVLWLITPTLSHIVADEGGFSKAVWASEESAATLARLLTFAGYDVARLVSGSKQERLSYATEASVDLFTDITTKYGDEPPQEFLHSSAT